MMMKRWSKKIFPNVTAKDATDEEIAKYDVDSPKQRNKNGHVSINLNSTPIEDVSFDAEMSEKSKISGKYCLPRELQWFEPMQVIGKGSFAKVFLVKSKENNKFYAMKVMSKKFIKDKDQVKNVQSERKLMSELCHPFVSKVRFSFQTACQLYIILDFHRGGELYYHMKTNKHFSDEVARFFLAEITLAVSYVQSKTIIFRDIKAENILMDATGHLKLSDFGLAKSGIGSWSTGATTSCGTPQYMAPEVFIRGDYGLGADWWGVGVLLYELIAGAAPFRGKKSKEIFANTVEKPLVLLRSWSDLTKSFLKGLLSKMPDNRLGSVRGHREILAHPYFDPVDLGALERFEIDPPYQPDVPEIVVLDASNPDSSNCASTIFQRRPSEHGGGAGRKGATGDTTMMANGSSLSLPLSPPPFPYRLNIDEANLAKNTDLNDFSMIYDGHTVEPGATEEEDAEGRYSYDVDDFTYASARGTFRTSNSY